MCLIAQLLNSAIQSIGFQQQLFGSVNTISTKNKNEYVGINKSHLYYTILAILLIINGFIIAKIVRTSVPDYVYPIIVEPQSETSVQTEQQPELIPESPDYTNLTASEQDINSGELILVNYAHGFVFDNSPRIIPKTELVSVYEHKTKSFSIRDTSIRLNLSITKPLSDMIDSFVAETGHDDIMIISAYRSMEDQQATYDGKISSLGEQQGKLTAALPGHSEHHTGYALDLNIYKNGESKTFDGTGDYKWFSENSWKYGFIERYADGKTDITKIIYEPWHYRYVGACHAEYIYKNGLCFEEYIELLKQYPYNGQHLMFTGYNGVSYEIYYVAINEDNNKVPVPKKENCRYSLSGNNHDGIIVTVEYTAESTTDDTHNAQPTQENTESTQTN